MDVFVHPLNRINIELLPLEVVERKGRGHPDTLCDAIAEVLSSEYARYCIDRYGGAAHHWFDKVVLSGAEASVEFGCGKLIKPYHVTVYGKAVRKVEGEDIPIACLARQAAIKVMAPLLHGFEPSAHLRIEDHSVDHHGTGNKATRYRPAARSDLEPVDKPNKRVSNDCNLCTAFAPLSRLEGAVLGVERWMTGLEFRSANPDIGSDIKAIGLRSGQSMSLEINVPFIADRIPSLHAYRERKRFLEKRLEDWLVEHKGETFNVSVNPGDDRRQPYLVALGSAADTGDVGVVGRGNRLNGLITPLRPMSIEASNGKNPLDHTGKIYAVVAQQISRLIFDEFSMANEVHLTTFKSRPLEDPYSAVVFLEREPGPLVQGRIDEIVRHQLSCCAGLANDFIYNGVTMY